MSEDQIGLSIQYGDGRKCRTVLAGGGRDDLERMVREHLSARDVTVSVESPTRGTLILGFDQSMVTIALDSPEGLFQYIEGPEGLGRITLDIGGQPTELDRCIVQASVTALDVMHDWVDGFEMPAEGEWLRC